MFYNENDLLGAINNFGSMDISYLLDKCNEWEISPYEINEDIDSIGYEKIDNINILFYSLYHIRLNRLIEKVEQLNIKVENQELFDNFKTKIITQLQDANIHCNCLCSCFDNELAIRLDEAEDFEEKVLRIFQEREESYGNWFFNSKN